MPDETRPGSGADAGAIGAEDGPRDAGAAATETSAQTLAWNRPARAPEAAPRASRRLGEQRSLFGEILDWMLAPLLLLWPLSVTITYIVAQNIANAPFDRNLEQSVDLLANRLRVERGEVTLQLPLPAGDLLREELPDSVMFKIVAAGGRLVAGDAELPSPTSDGGGTPGNVRLRDDMAHGNDVRVAFAWVRPPGPNGPAQPPVLVQVAEVLDKRAQLANEIIRGVIVPQFATLPIAVALVWFGLTRGLKPLSALQARIRARRPDDLAPIDPHAAPEELSPLVEAFNDLLARLEQTLASHKRFIADAAHQMKTPLAGLRTQAELALRETDPHELKRSLQQIAAATERATHLINQLLALARAEHQATDPTAFEAIDLAALARDLVRGWVPQALARRIDLGFETIDCGSDRPARVIGAPMLLRELLKNLIDNALRYTPPSGSVTVRVRAGTSVFLEVEDTGTGIAEAERHRVFDRFYRVLGTAADGSGLGLAIVREIVTQHEALLRIGENPRSSSASFPGTLISIEFSHTAGTPPTLQIA